MISTTLLRKKEKKEIKQRNSFIVLCLDRFYLVSELVVIKKRSLVLKIQNNGGFKSFDKV